MRLPIISGLDLLPDLFFRHPALPPSSASIMHGKRARTVSTSPQYERVIWVEKKTARGSKISAKVSNSPRTPKIRKQGTPHSKRRKMLVSPISQTGSGIEICHTPNTPLPIKLKTKPGKVCSTLDLYLAEIIDGYLGIARPRDTLRMASLPKWLYFRDPWP